MTGVETLWDVDAGRRLWRRTDVSVETRPSAGLFSVYEDWRTHLDLFGSMGETLPTTTAVRDIETAALLYRHWGDDFLACVSPDGERAADKYGRVYALPVGANLLLLALCQALLALPIVVVWSVLRWRRKHRPGSASVVP